MKRPETPPGALRRRDDEDVFDEPWQAQVLGMADALIIGRVIAADAWANALGAALRDHEAAGADDDAETYYHAVLDALQTLLLETGAVAPDDVDRREWQWRQAYFNTPHGEPVELSAGTKD